MRKKVAVIWGGKSPEHDVSVISGLGIFPAIDVDLFDPIPVYIDPNGRWFTGSSKLLNKSNYMFTEHELAKFKQVFPFSNGTKHELIEVNKGFFPSRIEFDIALPILHGSFGENGCIQGMFEALSIPYAGMRSNACCIFMDKELTKILCCKLEINTLPYTIFHKPASGSLINRSEIEEHNLVFPCCVKPANLGSSIGVAKAQTLDEVQQQLSNIFKFDTKALVEPYIEDAIEYQIATMSGQNGEVLLSAIQIPKKKAGGDLLTFNDKYANGLKSAKSPRASAENLLSKIILNPEIDELLRAKIIEISKKVFSSVSKYGAPRIDFLFNPETSELVFNELNSIPGTYEYPSWEYSEHNIHFSELITKLLNEAESVVQPQIIIPEEARLLKRRT